MENYTYKNIQYLDGIEHIRLRPAMYIGDIGINGLHQLLTEVIDNSIDEYLSGYCTKIIITFHKNEYITVLDNGRGIPVDLYKNKGISTLEVIMTKVGAGGKFDKKAYKISGGLHGVGISCVNALSCYLIARIFRNGKIYEQIYSKGIPITKLNKLNKLDKKNKKQMRGTEITFQVEKYFFGKTIFDYNLILNRIKELSYLNKGLLLILIDKRFYPNKKEFCYSKKGIKEFILNLSKDKNYLKKFFYLKKKKKKIQLELAMKFNSSFKEKIYSYVNNIPTPSGGTHISGFKRALTKTFKKLYYKYNLYKKSKIEISGKDIREGIIAIISMSIANPQFEGQTKKKLGNNEIIGLVEKIVSNELNLFINANPLLKNKILKKVFLTVKAFQAYKKVRNLIQKQINNIFPLKLADCSSNNHNLCEIYLVEGDSAGGTAKQGRERKFQAVFPLRGKILNVEKSMKEKIFENEEIRNLFSVLGIFLIKKEKKMVLNIKNIRYKKIIIMTDADIDGSHISTLILTFFFRNLKILIEKGYIYIATPPLFLIKHFNKKLYAWNEKEKEKILKNIGNLKGIHIQRYKGLGEMDAEQLWETTMNPLNRTLRQVKIDNLKNANSLFSMLMGQNVFKRRKFIEQNALFANIDA
ncbi:DNA gyrase/topoisomerase IV subunit B [Candidatus Karelsulcia muelleri]|uniref:DNA gyrase/topoisomerase IV subunit B n=1 Tax=Candidatus Karelsulcia muelleri TaxID=336810 RepID=UPI000D7CC535|nr:DNA gyrase subunit B [Candidatus Karelsulcia muelleri]